ncbi:Bgt-5199 [Blumeria graminis f. sp. tritici]|uniref:Bgt-5199 n=2 Tax=Blumeria graminis f. sp. tritici TaxID=62690 RepID=A0A061HKT3_BLUGR|nr:hypothetical protein BGT96224_5199 [Blumeria graminis f. sp. tritici 96224]VCU38894.1 Bgt-5199 [Blumeria graminis f. sp. tritici]
MAPKPSQPPNLSSASGSPNLASKRNRASRSDDEEINSTSRKQHRRVSKACERCRLKKTKVCSSNALKTPTLMRLKISVMGKCHVNGVQMTELPVVKELERKVDLKLLPRGRFSFHHYLP